MAYKEYIKNNKRITPCQRSALLMQRKSFYVPRESDKQLITLLHACEDNITQYARVYSLIEHFIDYKNVKALLDHARANNVKETLTFTRIS